MSQIKHSKVLTENKIAETQNSRIFSQINVGQLNEQFSKQKNATNTQDSVTSSFGHVINPSENTFHFHKHNDKQQILKQQLEEVKLNNSQKIIDYEIKVLECESLKDSLKDSQKQNDQLRQRIFDLEAAEKSITALTQSLSKEKEDKQKTKIQFEKLQRLMKNKQEQLLRIQAEKDQLTEQAKKKDKQLKQLVEERDFVNKQYLDSQKQIQQVKKSHDQIIKEIQKEKHNLLSSHQTKWVELDEKIKHQKQQSLQKDMMSERQIKQFENQIKLLRSDSQTYKELYKNTLKEFNKYKVEYLLKTQEGKEDQQNLKIIEDLKTQKFKLEQINQKLQQEAQVSKGKMKDLQKQLLKSMSEIQKLEKLKPQNINNDIMMNKNARQLQKIQRLQKNRKELIEEIEELKLQLKACSSELKVSQEEKIKLEIKIKDLLNEKQ